MLSLLLSLAAPAHACSFAVGEAHAIVENPADTTAPSAPADPVADVSRGVGPDCTLGSCAASSCDDIGIIGVTVGASSDDVSSPEAIGYRMRVVEGALPDGLQVDETRRADSLDGSDASLALIWIDDATDEQEAFDFVLGITAVDEAGNESAEVTLEVSDPGRSAAAGGCATVQGAGGLALALGLIAVGARRRR